MLVGFNPNISNNQVNKQGIAFRALPIQKITSSVNAAEIFRIQASSGKALGGKLYPNNPENAKDLLKAIEQADDIEIKGVLSDVATLWGLLKK